MSTRQERLNQLALRNGLGYVEAEDGFAYLLAEDGERIARLSGPFVTAVADVDDGDAETILCQLHNVHLNSSQQSFQRGVRAGRSTIVQTVHELLGIDRIVEALERSATHI